MSISAEEILDFWFVKSSPVQWFQKSELFDTEIKNRFSGIFNQAMSGVCDDWMSTPRGSLALTIVLDQFSRNMFRGTPKAFEADPKARQVAEQTIDKGFDQQLSTQERFFIYLPFEHSENLEDQRRSVALFAEMKEQEPVGYDYALRHLDVIERFGRFPHRNEILGRTSTAEELEYLAQPGAGF